MQNKEEGYLSGEIAQLLEATSRSKKAFLKLKEIAVIVKDYELAAKLRELEYKYFPITEESKQAKLNAAKLAGVLRLSNIKVDDKTAYIFLETVKVFLEKSDKFSLADAAKIEAATEQLFAA